VGVGPRIGGRLAGLLCFAAALPWTGAALAVDSRAEVQINLCGDPALVIRALHLTAKGMPTKVWLFDSPSLELNRQGLRLRLRVRGKDAEMTLKAGGQDCAKVDAASLQPDGKCEADLHGDTFEDVVSLTHRLSGHKRAALLAPQAGMEKPLTYVLAGTLDARQRKLLGARRGTAAGSALLPADIARLGPSTVRSYVRAGQAYGVEIWALPAGQQFVEISQKVARGQALVRRTEIQQQLAAAGVAICPDQESQARDKLRILAR